MISGSVPSPDKKANWTSEDGASKKHRQLGWQLFNRPSGTEDDRDGGGDDQSSRHQGNDFDCLV
ncbi:hypothetical protein [Neorhizobium galegae]|uniref:hypothetical protein n=1 Tax=Neorhizobium galegae TaxID=399 RepID=UPI0021059CF1|nr:hypothetical protein [Neorhizobium galegae]MCQ1850379.1 hypothetical protein [Neorhizobium galegae]